MIPMRLTPATQLPEGDDWQYEVKYDGFRCLLLIDTNNVQLLSKTGKVLNSAFPEIEAFIQQLTNALQPYVPLQLDGELVHLVNSYKSHFSTVQKRSRMKKVTAIEQLATTLPCHLVVFDLLKINGTSLVTIPLHQRQKQLSLLFKTLDLPLSVIPEDSRYLQYINPSTSMDRLWDKIVQFNGEGLIAKKAASSYKEGIRSKQWLKKKFWRMINVILIELNELNGYFQGAVYREDTLIPIVDVKHGFSDKERQTLISIFTQNGQRMTSTTWQLTPSICVSVGCIDFDGSHLREPCFSSFLLEEHPDHCTWEQMQRQLYPLPSPVVVTHRDKPIWPDDHVTKDDYLIFLQQVGPSMLPFLHNRLLTVIRYPHGVDGDAFYQKNIPDYAPDFVNTIQEDDISYITCNSMDTLLWLGNQLALEFHIPFQPYTERKPTEIVLDLDPPSVNHFPLAIEAAQRFKAIFNECHITSFIKTSGRKGLQLYIPLPKGRFSYDETRTVTSFLCHFLCEQEPSLFTTERLKKNRGERLYLDYLQHDAGKTLIAPYSPRGEKEGTVSVPLYWEEVNEDLSPSHFTVKNVADRLLQKGDPFRFMYETTNESAIETLLGRLRE
ncbi:DNA ligase D [Salipaludibacillus agaradhaerens]|uniref:DNA ligase D n=1 Tax=Salipaludibacillus agaradhaerens TaxID=76935 RepID=UPI0021515AB6|nr:DNA ligase D [Salipaludibacillus agaradhaerens]MCR6108280.1 DNA ligase D [Salipaludibacillus agaradhaerens]MCR6120305.1 DNA ligase D [Salipaludibacillus agaradhaerens]UJW59323.1 DNA ligase D [Bacillus sp. A116_S68]